MGQDRKINQYNRVESSETSMNTGKLDYNRQSLQIMG